MPRPLGVHFDCCPLQAGDELPETGQLQPFVFRRSPGASFERSFRIDNSSMVRLVSGVVYIVFRAAEALEEGFPNLVLLLGVIFSFA